MHRLLGWRFLAVLVLLLAVPPVLSVVDVPGEGIVKDALGISGPTVQRCGEIRHAGRFGGAWRREAKLGGIRDEARAVRIGDGIYIVGGLVSLNLAVDPGTAQSVNTFERYQPSTGRYERLPPLPTRRSHVGAATYGGDVYVVGGFTDQLGRAEASGELWRYRPSERRWQALEPMPTPRGGHGVAVVGDRMFVVGGQHLGLRVDTTEVYDFRTGVWSTAAPIPTPRDHIGVSELGGKIFAAGGRQERDYSLGALEVYDTAEDRWTKLPDLPRPASSFDFVRAGDRLIAVGGGDANASPYWISGQTWSYEPRRRRWTQLESTPVPKHGYAAAIVGDRLFVFGGSRCGAFRATDSVESMRLRRG